MNCRRIVQERAAQQRFPVAFCVRAAGMMLCAVIGTSSVYAAESDHDNIRWDIIHVDFTSPNIIKPGGTSIASADVTTNQITFTDSSGTFLAPESGRISHDVTGGGKWTTSDGMTTKSGTYKVTAVVSWQFANFQTNPAIDLIDPHPKANGNAILLIQYDDGDQGVLGVGCHGPGAPPGIQEGVIATKGFVTYWLGAAHGPGVSINFTSFHVLDADER
jgi:hypothetical protein